MIHETGRIERCGLFLAQSRSAVVSGVVSEFLADRLLPTLGEFLSLGVWVFGPGIFGFFAAGILAKLAGDDEESKRIRCGRARGD